MYRLEVSHIQYDDDTVLVGEPSLENILTIRLFFHSFKLALSLKVIFLRIVLMWI